MGKQTHTCHACGGCIEDEEPLQIQNQRTGNVWHSHAKDECRRAPVPDSYAATARMMKEIFDDDDPDFDWDRWKDDMKEGDL